MNIFGVGLGEILAILVIAMLVVGPERMVQFSQQLGSFVGKLRRETDGITKEFREAFSLDLDLDEDGGGQASSRGSGDTSTRVEAEPKQIPAPEPVTSLFVDGEVKMDRSAERAAAETEMYDDEPVEVEVAELVSEDAEVEPVVIEQPAVVMDEAPDDQQADGGDEAENRG